MGWGKSSPAGYQPAAAVAAGGEGDWIEAAGEVSVIEGEVGGSLDSPFSKPSPLHSCSSGSGLARNDGLQEGRVQPWSVEGADSDILQVSANSFTSLSFSPHPCTT
jgi:hypothetical protein